MGKRKYVKQDEAQVRLDALRELWEAWKPTNKPSEPYYMEYWPTDAGSWYIFFPNQNFGHELKDREDAEVANQWRPALTYHHLVYRYGRNA